MRLVRYRVLQTKIEKMTVEIVTKGLLQEEWKDQTGTGRWYFAAEYAAPPERRKLERAAATAASVVWAAAAACVHSADGKYGRH